MHCESVLHVLRSEHIRNRLDDAINSLEQEGQDMTAALSRIEDVDMAGEMTEYTAITCAYTGKATSVLAQANDILQRGTSSYSKQVRKYGKRKDHRVYQKDQSVQPKRTGH